MRSNSQIVIVENEWNRSPGKKEEGVVCRCSQLLPPIQLLFCLEFCLEVAIVCQYDCLLMELSIRYQRVYQRTSFYSCIVFVVIIIIMLTQCLHSYTLHMYILYVIKNEMTSLLWSMKHKTTKVNLFHCIVFSVDKKILWIFESIAQIPIFFRLLDFIS